MSAPKREEDSPQAKDAVELAETPADAAEQPRPPLDDGEAEALARQVFQTHAHVHVHADGTVHNHYHRHEGGEAVHEHAETGVLGHAGIRSCDHVEGAHGFAVPATGDAPHVHATAHSHAGERGPAQEHVSEQGEPPLHAHDAVPFGAAVLAARDLSYAYPSTDRLVFAGIDLDVRAGAVLAILGNNGAGKSTLLNLLAGIARPTSGTVDVEGRPLSSLSRREVAQHIAYVAQQQRVPHLSVYDQVLLGRRPHVTWALSDYDRTVVAETIDRLGLEPFSARFLDELSGGERQKVYIARALAQEPEVLLLDEPTSALDPKNQLEVLETVRSITRQGSLASVLVIHDINLALRFCDRFLLVRDGVVVAQGGREAVTNDTLSATYDMPFLVEQVAGVPVAIPLGCSDE